MPFEKILVELDGSDVSFRALELALELAELTGARLTALAIEGPLPVYAATIGEVDEVKREKDAFFVKIAAKARAAAERAGVDLEVEVRAGHPAEVVVRYARGHGFDLIVVGHRGHFLGDYLLSSLADRIAHHAPCPVLVAK
jgi:nucleotide-binding universal stress UspA family protein